MNSICALVVHLTGAERYWIGDVVARESSERDRAAEFRVHGLAKAALKQRLETLDLLPQSRGKVDPSRPGSSSHFAQGWATIHNGLVTAARAGAHGDSRGPHPDHAADVGS